MSVLCVKKWNLNMDGFFLFGLTKTLDLVT